MDIAILYQFSVNILNTFYNLFYKNRPLLFDFAIRVITYKMVKSVLYITLCTNSLIQLRRKTLINKHVNLSIYICTYQSQAWRRLGNYHDILKVTLDRWSYYWRSGITNTGWNMVLNALVPVTSHIPFGGVFHQPIRQWIWWREIVAEVHWHYLSPKTYCLRTIRFMKNSPKSLHYWYYKTIKCNIIMWYN